MAKILAPFNFFLLSIKTCRLIKSAFVSIYFPFCLTYCYRGGVLTLQVNTEPFYAHVGSLLPAFLKKLIFLETFVLLYPYSGFLIISCSALKKVANSCCSLGLYFHCFHFIENN